MMIYLIISIKDKNFLFSPLNLSLGLCLCLAGAKKSSESELKHLLEYVHTSTNDIHKDNAKLTAYVKKFVQGIDFKFANRLLVKEGTSINKEFLESAKTFYSTGEVLTANFEDNTKVANDINTWIDETLKVEFKKRIVESLISSEYNLVLVNVVYFKGNWYKKFDKFLTKPADFNLADGSVVQVSMMSMSNRKFKYKENAAGLSASVCEFPFADEGLSMTIVLPNKNVTLAEVESQLTPEVLKETLEEYSFTVKVIVHVPRFKIESSSEVYTYLT